MLKLKILLVIILVITNIFFMYKSTFELWENYAKHRRHQNTLENMYLYRKYCLDSDDDDEAKFNCEDIKAIIESTKIDL